MTDSNKFDKGKGKVEQNDQIEEAASETAAARGTSKPTIGAVSA